MIFCYTDWLEKCIDSGINMCRARDVMSDNKIIKDKLNLVLRHDIDEITVSSILAMADHEERLGIRSTFYIIINPEYKYYQTHKEIFLELQERGHEIGLHVNSIERSHIPEWEFRDFDGAKKQLRKDIKEIMGDGFDIKTISAHGLVGPRTHYTNKNLLHDVKISGIYSFSEYFKDRECLLTDSMGRLVISEEENILNPVSPLPGVRYTITHPAQYFGKNLKFAFREKWEPRYYFIESMSDKELRTAI